MRDSFIIFPFEHIIHEFRWDLKTAKLLKGVRKNWREPVLISYNNKLLNENPTLLIISL